MAETRGPGRPSAYPGKVRDEPVSAVLTPEGHRILANLALALQLSRSDVIERALRLLAEQAKVQIPGTL